MVNTFCISIFKAVRIQNMGKKDFLLQTANGTKLSFQQNEKLVV